MTQYWFRLRFATSEILTTEQAECHDVESAIMQAYTFILEALRDVEVRAACSEFFADAVDGDGYVKFSVPFTAVITSAPKTDPAEPKSVNRQSDSGRRVVSLAAARRKRQSRTAFRENAPSVRPEGKVLTLPIRRAGGTSR